MHETRSSSPSMPLVVAARVLSAVYVAVALLFVVGAIKNGDAADAGLRVSMGLGIALGFGGLAVATFVVHPGAVRASVWLCVCWLMMAPFACFPLFADDLGYNAPVTRQVTQQLWRLVFAVLPPLSFLIIVAIDHAQRTRRAAITAAPPDSSR